MTGGDVSALFFRDKAFATGLTARCPRAGDASSRDRQGRATHVAGGAAFLQQAAPQAFRQPMPKSFARNWQRWKACHVIP